MDSVIVDSDFPHDLVNRGARDARRHNKKVQDAARKQLKDLITSQDIITSSGNKKVKVRLKHLDQYEFRHHPDRVDIVGRDEFDELDEGEIISRPDHDASIGRGVKPGDAAGEELYEVEFTVDDLTEMMIKELRLPNLDESIKSEIVSEVIEWTDRRKSSGIHGLIDKKQTLLANIKRKAQMGYGPGEKVPIVNDDLRFRTWEIQRERHSNAVLFAMMDRSGSMWEDKIYACKAFYFWVVQFLRKKYDRVEIRFIAHDYNAKEMTEADFFTISEDGGTRVSTAYTLCRDIIKYEYPSSKWNVYCFHASDGDSWDDEMECYDLITEIINLGVKQFGYVEIQDEYDGDESELWGIIENAAQDHDRVMLTSIGELDDVMKAIQYFFGNKSRITKNVEIE